ncbi:MAG: hypothetical protein KF874_13775 [Rhizobiaceae bacterium]|nr:hypothetical protein [Rhizobiaceae bacterium]
MKLEFYTSFLRIKKPKGMIPTQIRRWVLIAAAIGGVALFYATRTAQYPSAISIIAALDQGCLGCGYDASTKTTSQHPMAFALLASAGAHLNDSSLTRTAADWLVTNANKASGWGLGFAWDAFQDGSVNPSDTTYGITTALGVSALLDAYEQTGEAFYADAALRALTYYQQSFTATERGGFFWYSDQPADAINTPNVSSMMMGQYARAGKLFHRADFMRLASLAAQQLLADAKTVNGARFWSYYDRTERPNDAVHAAYIVRGLQEFNRYSDQFGASENLEGCAEYLLSFYQNGVVLEYSPLHSLPPDQATLPARLWGVGMLLYTLTDIGRKKDAENMAKALNQYLTADGKNLASRPKHSDVGEPRMLAHAALGLARLEKASRWW